MSSCRAVHPARRQPPSTPSPRTAVCADAGFQCCASLCICPVPCPNPVWDATLAPNIGPHVCRVTRAMAYHQGWHRGWPGCCLVIASTSGAVVVCPKCGVAMRAMGAPWCDIPLTHTSHSRATRCPHTLSCGAARGLAREPPPAPPPCSLLFVHGCTTCCCVAAPRLFFVDGRRVVSAISLFILSSVALLRRRWVWRIASFRVLGDMLRSSWAKGGSVHHLALRCRPFASVAALRRRWPRRVQG